MPRYALIIGIAEYNSPALGTLPKAVTDAEQVAQLLEERGEFQQVERFPKRWNPTKRRSGQSDIGADELVARRVTADELHQTIKDFLSNAAIQKNDALIYFTGHGFIVTQRDHLQGFLATSNCDLRLENGRVVEQSHAYEMGSLDSLLAQSDLSSLVLLLDCCHSGQFIERDEMRQTLTTFGKRTDYCLITACRGHERAWVGSDHSVFTGALLAGLSASNADQDGWIDSDRLSAFLYHRLRQSGQEPLRLYLGRPIPLVHYPPVTATPIVSAPFNRINPYIGLYAFKQDQADYFNGRDNAVWKLLDLVKTSRFISVIGASGSGKSSLVKAGLLSQLRDDRIPNSSQWAVDTLTPGDRPLPLLLEKLETLQHQPQSLLFVDQFEEIFTVCKDDNERRSFIHLIAHAATRTDQEIRIIVAVRGDFLDRCAQYPEIARLINRTEPTTYAIEGLTETELHESITKPALRHGVEFEQGLIDQIIQDVIDEPGPLPLLQHALWELWRECIEKPATPQPVLTWAGYNTIGRVAGALERRADLLYESCTTEEERRLFRTLFMELVEIQAANDTVTRRPIPLQRLQDKANAPDLLDRILSRLDSRRLLVISERKVGEAYEPYVDVAHEALLTQWSRLNTWINESKDDIRLERRFEEYCRDWHDTYQRSDSALLSGVTLDAVLTWSQKPQTHLSSIGQAYLRASLEKRDREQQEREQQLQEKLTKEQQLRELEESRRQEAEARTTEARARVKAERKKAQVAIASSAFILCLTFLSALQWRASDRGQIKALVASSEANFRLNPTSMDALLDGLRAGQRLQQSLWFRTDPQLQTEVRQALGNALFSVREQNRLVGHSNYVTKVSFSPDGQLLASASFDKTAKVWSLDGKELFTLKGHSEELTCVTFSPDSQRIATCSQDGTVRLWTSKDGSPIDVLEGHTDAVRSASFSSIDGSIATASKDGTVRLWDRDGNPLKTLTDHFGKVYSVSYSPDGQKLASASDDRTILLRDKDGNLLHRLQGHTDAVYGISFSPDSQTVATASRDRTVILWDAKTGIKMLTLQGHTAEAIDVAFSPTQQIIATASFDHTIKLWDLQGLLLATFKGHDGHVVGLSFNQNGLLASASEDQTVKFWQLENIKQIVRLSR